MTLKEFVSSLANYQVGERRLFIILVLQVCTRGGTVVGFLGVIYLFIVQREHYSIKRTKMQPYAHVQHNQTHEMCAIYRIQRGDVVLGNEFNQT